MQDNGASTVMLVKRFNYSMMSSKTLSSLLIFLAAFSGTLLYIITGNLLDGGIANLVWGTAYGLGFFVLSQFFFPVPGPGGMTFFLVGAVLWPLLLTVAMLTAATKFQWGKDSRRAVNSIFIFTLFLLYPMKLSPGTVAYYLPIYGVYLSDF
jgi:hypothetical protein